jgi:hypothetical protein
MPYAFSRCHCEEALAEADAAIQSGSSCALPVVPLDCRVGAVAPPRNDKVCGVKMGAFPLDCRVAYAPRNDRVSGVGGKTYDAPTESSSLIFWERKVLTRDW